MYRREVTLKWADVSVRTASIIKALMMEAVRTYEMSVRFNVTTSRENLKSHRPVLWF
jgi:hypothetical protein